MRISCPYCGERDHAEFTYLRRRRAPPRPGPATRGTTRRRSSTTSTCATTRRAHREFGTTGGCRAWLVVERDVTTHAISGRRRRDWPQRERPMTDPPAHARRRVEERAAPAPASAGTATEPFRTSTAAPRARLHLRRQGHAGQPGDTLASALLANGVRLVGRSFKYHRPRGILSAGSEEPNALVELRSGARREPNTRATAAELFDGLEARSQNRWPSLRFDALAVNALVAPVFGAGFYYKTFMWPASFWEKVYEPLIRRAAGLGRAAEAPDPDHYDKVTAFCDVLVIGAGPAGLMAALTAGRSGARVILVPRGFRARRPAASPRAAASAARRVRPSSRASRRNWRRCRRSASYARTTVFGVYDGGDYAAVERVSDHLPVPPAHQPRQRLWRIVAKRSILATGSIERPLVFGDNDRPGVMLAGAVRSYLNRFGVKPGAARSCSATTTTLIAPPRTSTDAGVTLAAVVDPRPEALAGLRDLAGTAGARLIEGVVTRAVGTSGGRECSRDRRGWASFSIPCDVLAVSGGWQPTIHLSTHLGGKPALGHRAGRLPARHAAARHGSRGRRQRRFRARRLPRGWRAERRGCRGGGGLPPALGRGALGRRESTAVTPAVAGETPQGQGLRRFPERRLRRRRRHRASGRVPRGGASQALHDARHGDRPGQDRQRQRPRLDGGADGRGIPEVGTTRFRPPYTPVAIGALAGHHSGPTLCRPG